MSNKIRVLHYSPHDEDDGIAKYLDQYVVAMKDYDNIENTVFDVTPMQLHRMTPQQQEQAFNALDHQLRNFDMLHIQHEFGLFKDDEFERLVKIAKGQNKKV